MTLPLILFWIFAVTILASATIVVSTRNMVYAVIFLILAFFNASGLFILLGAEYIAMLLIIVYVGAIAVLFLFVVMMLDIDKLIKNEISRSKPLLFLIAVVLFGEILITLQISKSSSGLASRPIPNNIDNITAIGQVLYTDFFLPFQLAGAVLFVAMVGAIILTLKEENLFVLKQEISTQTMRNPSNSIIITKPEIGHGIDL